MLKLRRMALMLALAAVREALTLMEDCGLAEPWAAEKAAAEKAAGQNAQAADKE